MSSSPRGRPLPHTHRDADEFFFVVEGRVDVLLEDAWRPLGPGQFLHVPRGTLHTFRNATTEAARMLSGFVPSGFERFFRDFGQSARLDDVEPLPVQEADIQRLNATASQYDMELGPRRAFGGVDAEACLPTRAGAVGIRGADPDGQGW